MPMRQQDLPDVALDDQRHVCGGTVTTVTVQMTSP